MVSLEQGPPDPKFEVLNATVHGKTYFNAYPLNGQNR